MFSNVGINTRLIIRFFSISLIILAVLMLISGIVGDFYDQNDPYIFYINSGVFALAAFLLLYYLPLKSNPSVTTKDSFLLIIFLWVCVPLVGMTPFIFASPIDNFTDALFESYAGFTTTGFTTLSEYENVSKTIIFWRSIIQWLGGMGILLFIITVFPFLNKGQTKIFFSDLQDVEYSPLHHRIGTTARMLWLVYILYSAIGIIALKFAGLDIFDSVIYSFAAISTGGGVPVNGDLTHMSTVIKTIIMILMFIAGANYFFLFKSLRKFKFIKSEEINTYVMVLLFSFLLIAAAGIAHYGFSGKLVFESLFNTVSFVSTTGFFSAEVFSANILFIWVLLFFLLFIGSSTGSSGGGINIYRIIVLFKMLKNYIKETIHPSSISSVRLDNKIVDFKIMHSIIAFFVLYILIFITGALFLTFFGYNLESAFSLCAAAMSNTGPGVFLLNDYFSISDINIGAKYTVMMLMIIGRVELLPFLIIISRSFWTR